MVPSNATQTRHPWRATARTVFAVVVALAALIPVVVAAEASLLTLPGVAAVVAVAGTVTRILAIPGVDAFLKTYLPFLAAEPKNEV